MTFTKMIAAGAAALVLAGAAHANGLADGSFAEGANANSFATYSAGNAFGDWNVDSGSIDLIGSYWGGHGGSYSVDMNGNGPGAISQSFTLAAGEYTLSFWMSGNPDGGAGTQSVKAIVGDASQVFNFVVTPGQTRSNMGWTLETLTFSTAGATTLTFDSNTASGPYGASISDISVSAVPEPASLGLLLAGIGMLGVMSSRRRAR